ncbi:hypothetical protein AK812_SmicGene25377 [Symbiodinium microadriaticum]|uniref:PPM-type phosphatase domain-containing protein n=2 Tax=Symbiodinium TaxID=2949 RepID=A0A1Q9DC63_SYMMI|nr:hypothetical protein AK812_SmicGene25377 [Symbiodinium microadriaticum]
MRQDWQKWAASSKRNAFNLVGSTAIVALLDKTGGKRSVTVANCGDSRAVLCRNGTASDPDHGNFQCRCVLRVSEAVELSEARPDLSAEQQKVIAVPEETASPSHFALDVLLKVLACDGCFELHTSQAAEELVDQSCSPNLVKTRGKGFDLRGAGRPKSKRLLGFELVFAVLADSTCQSKHHEDWPSVHRRLLRLLDGQGGTETLADELDRAASSFAERAVPGLDGTLETDCIPGRVSLDLLLLLSQQNGLTDAHDIWKEGGLLDFKRDLLAAWPAVARSGWPVFRLLRLLQNRAQAHAAAPPLTGCHEDEDEFAATMMKHVRHRKPQDEALLATSAMFVLNSPSSRCPLSVAAAYLSSAWARFPVFDEETEDLLGLAEMNMRNVSLARLLTTQHPLLDMLDDVASSYQEEEKEGRKEGRKEGGKEGGRTSPPKPTPDVEPGDPTAASSSQPPSQQQPGTQAATAPPREDPTSKQGTLALQQAEERAQQHPHPAAAAAEEQHHPRPAISGNHPIRVPETPNEDPTSKEGTRAAEEAKRRKPPQRQANASQQRGERPRHEQWFPVGDVAAWTTTVMPEGTEVSHHNHILLPSQGVHDDEPPQQAQPRGSSSQAGGSHTGDGIGDGTPHKAAPPRPPSSSSSGNRSEKAWPSEEGGDHDRTELMQRHPPQQQGGQRGNPLPSKGRPAAAPAMKDEDQQRGQLTPAPHQDRSEQPAAAANPLLGAPSTQTQEEMLAVAMLVETGQANRAEWTGDRNPCASTLEATVPEATLPSQQQQEEPGTSPSRKHRRTRPPQQQPDPEPGLAASLEHEQGQNSTATAPQQRIPEHRPLSCLSQQKRWDSFSSGLEGYGDTMSNWWGTRGRTPAARPGDSTLESASVDKGASGECPNGAVDTGGQAEQGERRAWTPRHLLRHSTPPTAQAFLIDSGALYVDLRDENSSKATEPRVDYTRHMMVTDDFTSKAAPATCTDDALTPSGRCNSFAALGNAMLPWQTGISQEDTVRALHEDGVEALVFRLVESHSASAELLLLAVPEALEAHGQLIDCLAAAIIAAIGAMLPGMPRLEMVVSLGNEAVSQRRSYSWSPPYGRREDVPPPVFSFCSDRKSFWDIPLPSSLCYRFRPRCKGKDSGDATSGRLTYTKQEEECYVFRLLTSYGELLRYRPMGRAMEEEAVTMDDLVLNSGVVVLKSWSVQSTPMAEEMTSRCDLLMARAAA